MRAMHLSRVLLPEPLWPMSPNVCPSGTSNDTPLRAQNSSCTVRLNPLKIVALSVELRSWMRRKRLATSLTSTASWATYSSSARRGSRRRNTTVPTARDTTATAVMVSHCKMVGNRRS